MAVVGATLLVTTTSPVQLVAASNRSETHVVVRHVPGASGTLMLGGSNVATTGFEAPADGAPVSLTLEVGEELWAIAGGTNSQAVAVLANNQ